MWKSSKKLSWLLLLVVALRGLMPAGYMIDATDRGLAVVVCDGGIYSAVAQSAHAHHHHGGSENAQHDHSICPFAIAATSASAPSLPVIGNTVSSSLDRLHDEAVVATGLFGPSRAQQSRAPPHLS